MPSSSKPADRRITFAVVDLTTVTDQATSRRNYNLCVVGFGNVGKALVKLLQRKSDELRREHGIEWKITGIASRRLGWIANVNGLDPEQMLNDSKRTLLQPAAGSVRDWLKAARADVLFEASSLNRQNGQPAIEHIRAALECRAHAISANKGPVLFAYSELRALALAQKKQFLFESTVMDGVPVFSLFRESLRAVKVTGFRGILNSTTNVVLGEMEAGLDFSQALCRAQAMGIAESDPSDDLEGWDAAAKIAALTIVILGHPLTLAEVARQGISHLDSAAVRAARQAGTPYKMVCRAQRRGNGVEASVRPERLALSDPLAWVNGASSCVHFELDILPGLTLIEQDPGLETTAYGMLADFIDAHTARRPPLTN
jgi:homoserine dehydrogenase